MLDLIASHIFTYVGPPKPAPPAKPGGGRPGGGRPYVPGPHVYNNNNGGGGGRLDGGTVTCLLVMLGVLVIGIILWKASRPDGPTETDSEDDD